MHKVLRLIVLLIMLRLANVRGEICELNRNRVSETKLIYCPRKNESSQYTKCCINVNADGFEELKCCIDTENDDPIKIISMFTIVVCIACASFVAVCCFWHQCPLFYTFSMFYDPPTVPAAMHIETVEYVNRSEMAMPEEGSANRQHYNINPVTVKRVYEQV